MFRFPKTSKACYSIELLTLPKLQAKLALEALEVPVGSLVLAFGSSHFVFLSFLKILVCFFFFLSDVSLLKTVRLLLQEETEQTRHAM